MTQIDDCGQDYVPSECFVVPRKAEDHSANLVVSGAAINYIYELACLKLVLRWEFG